MKSKKNATHAWNPVQVTFLCIGSEGKLQKSARLLFTFLTLILYPIFFYPYKLETFVFIDLQNPDLLFELIMLLYYT